MIALQSRLNNPGFCNYIRLNFANNHNLCMINPIEVDVDFSSAVTKSGIALAKNCCQCFSKKELKFDLTGETPAYEG
jgi:hypothetical protein